VLPGEECDDASGNALVLDDLRRVAVLRRDESPVLRVEERGLSSAARSLGVEEEEPRVPGEPLVVQLFVAVAKRVTEPAGALP